MSIALLDVNVLVALMDPGHVHHDAAHRWFERNHRSGWATCPIGLNGCVRIMMSRAYGQLVVPRAVLIEILRERLASPHHHFWADSISLTDASIFDIGAITGHQMITDAYLLGLAVRNHGRLATFDQAIPTRAVRGATASHVMVIR